jgi:hypothetical protein
MILHRIMTYKSKFMGGKYDKITVEKLMAYNPSYLRYAYYYYTSIDYIPEILEKIHITGEWIIDKPGKDIDKLNDWMNSHHLCGLPKYISDMKYKHRAKAKLLHIIRDSRFKKASLTWKNQGH